MHFLFESKNGQSNFDYSSVDLNGIQLKNWHESAVFDHLRWSFFTIIF